MKYLSLFSGIGSPEQALKNLGIEFELFGFSEIDKFAIKSYCAVHGVEESLNLGDITKINIESLPKDIDLITHGSPCQDFSVAGKGKGADEGTGTRSSLMWNTVAICEHCKPKYVVWENVKNVLSKKHRHNFDKYLDEMDRIGYNNFYQILNAKDYGVPQNRERIFVISIRKDLEKEFEFPIGRDFGIRLKDMLEDKVDEKYYLSDKIQERFKLSGIVDVEHNEINIVGTSAPDFRTIGQRDITYGVNGVMSTLTATDYKQPKQILESNNILQLGNIVNTGNWDNPQRGRIYSSGGISPTLTYGGESPKIVEKCSKQKIRKLTPRECWRLMGFKDEQFKKAEEVCSNSQLYKQAGNSIVVNVMEEIFKNLV